MAFFREKNYDTLEYSGFLLYKSGFLLYKNAKMERRLVAYGYDHKITGKTIVIR